MYNKFIFIALVLYQVECFYVLAPNKKNGDPFCYINAQSVNDHNVLHWKVIEPRPENFELFVSVTDKFGESLAKGSSKQEEDTLAFTYKKRDMVRICLESDQEDGQKVKIGYRLNTVQANTNRANLKQADHLNQIVLDAQNKLDNFMISEDNIDTAIDGIHSKSKEVAQNLKFSTKVEVVIIIVVFIFQFWHLRRFQLSKKM